MQSAPGTLTTEQLEEEAARLLGKLLFIYGRLETNLACLLDGAGETAPDRMSFQDKLVCLLKIVDARYQDDTEGYACWAEWYMLADCLRDLRNRLAHGRWGIWEYGQRVIHVAGLPSSTEQNEMRFSLPELASRIGDASSVASEFDALCTKLTPF